MWQYTQKVRAYHPNLRYPPLQINGKCSYCERGRIYWAAHIGGMELSQRPTIKCHGCGRYLSEITFFHVRDCTSKQMTLEDALKP